MSSQEERDKHRKRLKKTRSVIAQSLELDRFRRKVIERRRLEDEETKMYHKHKNHLLRILEDE